MLHTLVSIKHWRSNR